MEFTWWFQDERLISIAKSGRPHTLQSALYRREIVIPAKPSEI